MSDKNNADLRRVLLFYLVPALAQIALVCIAAAVLRSAGVVCGYSSLTGILLIIAGGMSSALWGIIYQVKYGGKRIVDIIRDYFHFKADPKAYLLVLLFIFMTFFSVFFGGTVNDKGIAGILLTFFISVTAFGGVEEIGWRYTFQPVIEKKLPYFAASLLTFLCWGTWHILFFFIDGSIGAVDLLPFLIGLMTNCFMFSAIYNYGKDLWLCVLAHSLVNTLSQVFSGGNIYVDMIMKTVAVVLAVIICRKSRNSEPVNVTGDK